MDDVILELDDIQSGALFERPSPYVGVYLLLSIRDRRDGEGPGRGRGPGEGRGPGGGHGRGPKAGPDAWDA